MYLPKNETQDVKFSIFKNGLLPIDRTQRKLQGTEKFKHTQFGRP